MNMTELEEQEKREAERLGEKGDRLSLEEDDEHVHHLVDPRMPTEEEISKHYFTGHIPYRNWCPVCVQAEGRQMGHFKDTREDRKVPEYSWDYCFPGDELGFKWTVLV